MPQTAIQIPVLNSGLPEYRQARWTTKTPKGAATRNGKKPHFQQNPKKVGTNSQRSRGSLPSWRLSITQLRKNSRYATVNNTLRAAAAGTTIENGTATR